MIETLLAAKRPEDVFGELPTDCGKAWAKLKGLYLEAVKQVHPDRNHDPRAEEAFKTLQRLYDVAKRSVKAGNYGKGNAIVDEIVITTKRRSYKVTDLFTQGDVSNIYKGSSDNEPVYVKITRSARDNDLMANEARALKSILGDKEFFDEAQPYLPGYIETFGYRPGGRGQARQATSFYVPEYPLYTLEQVRRAYPEGIHPKDMAWMLRRLFMAIGFAHAKGLVHGAVLPCHVLIQPDMHGLVLIDWKAATETEPIKVISKPWKSFYPEWVLNKEKAKFATDIYMAAECMRYVCGDQLRYSKRIRAFFNGMQVRNTPKAWDLKDEFDELLENMWGPRRFRPFHMAAPL